MLYKFDKPINKKKAHLAHVIKKHLVNILQTTVQDLRVKWVTITRVELNKDSSLAVIYYSVLGGQDQIEVTEKVLNTAKGFIRSQLSKRLDIYKTPSLKFIFDITTIAYNNEMLQE